MFFSAAILIIFFFILRCLRCCVNGLDPFYLQASRPALAHRLLVDAAERLDSQLREGGGVQCGRVGHGPAAVDVLEVGQGEDQIFKGEEGRRQGWVEGVRRADVNLSQSYEIRDESRFATFAYLENVLETSF